MLECTGLQLYSCLGAIVYILHSFSKECQQPTQTLLSFYKPESDTDLNQLSLHCTTDMPGVPVLEAGKCKPMHISEGFGIMVIWLLTLGYIYCEEEGRRVSGATATSTQQPDSRWVSVHFMHYSTLKNLNDKLRSLSWV